MQKIVLYIMNEKGYYVLKNLIVNSLFENIEYVVTAEDKNLKKDYYLECKDLCQRFNVKCYNRREKIPDFSGYKIAIGWRWIINNSEKLIVFHDSILPKYRGFAPLVNMLINGEKEIGVTALSATNDYDKGDIIAQEKLSIQYPIKIQEAIEKITPLYYKLVKIILGKIIQNEELPAFSQEEKLASYSLWRDEGDYRISWNQTAQEIRRRVDALGHPYAGAKALLNGKLIIIAEVEELKDIKIENRDVGKVVYMIEGLPCVVCKEGILLIKSAFYEKDGESIFPFRKFRSRFK